MRFRRQLEKMENLTSCFNTNIISANGEYR